MSTMKIKQINPSHMKGPMKNLSMSPPIPLSRPEETISNKDDMLKFKLYSNPTDKDGASYEIKVKKFLTGTPEEYIKTVVALKKVLRGQDIVTGAEQYTMARRLFDGEALTSFNNASTTTGAETVANLDVVLKKVAGSVFPLRAYINQKQAMRRFM
jgi:hypothetical protein